MDKRGMVCGGCVRIVSLRGALALSRSSLLLTMGLLRREKYPPRNDIMSLQLFICVSR